MTAIAQDSSASAQPTTRVAVGLFAGVSAFCFWGLVPIYFKWVDHINPWVVLAHRGIWSSVFLTLLLVSQRKFGVMRQAILKPSILLRHLATTAVIACNWICFIYAVQIDKVLYASLGYFINPLLSVLMGVIFLSERLRRYQLVCIGIAFAGVTLYAIAIGGVPWLSLGMAFSFGFYGLIKKTLHVPANAGVWAETTLMTPVALVVISLLPMLSDVPNADARHPFALDMTLLIGSGLITALPLIWFAMAASRVRLSTIGLLQYLAPSGQFLIGWLLFKEPMDALRFAAFALIWLALIIFTVEGYLHQRRGAVMRPLA